MTRSIWKGPFVESTLLKKAQAVSSSGKKEVIKDLTSAHLEISNWLINSLSSLRYKLSPLTMDKRIPPPTTGPPGNLSPFQILIAFSRESWEVLAE